MKTRVGLVALVLLLCLAVVRPVSEVVHGCAAAPRQGARVEIAKESAIILWDARSRTEHFIRRATFATDTPDFGFLVPTPTQPTLAEASDAAFTRLDQLTAPEVVIERRPMKVGNGDKTANAAPAGRASVRILAMQRVAGYDAVVLEADKAAALKKWLGQNEYAARPDLTEWLEPYVKDHWKLTAFKIAKQSKDRPGVATGAVRMTFTTDRPFFPYSEPAQQRQLRQEKASWRGPQTRMLRVFLLADRRMEGSLGDVKGHWPGRVVWTNRLNKTALTEVLTPLTGYPERNQPNFATFLSLLGYLNFG